MPGAVATRYAHALADAVMSPAAAEAEGRQVAEQLRAFQAAADASPELKNVLLSPAVPPAKKRAVVQRLADAIPLSRILRNFLFLLIDRRRTALVGDIADAFETVLDERLGFVRAEVSSAAPLADEQRAAIQAALSKAAGKNVRCEFQVDPALIGGVVARIGSTVYDGSVRTQLDSLRQRLVS